ncbi:MAG: deoxyribose-phosphate aldolase [Rhodoferax sp.]
MTDSWTTDLPRSARLALQCLDLTSLNDADTETEVQALCQRAQGRFGSTAAVCVWPRLAAFARAQLPTAVSVAAVANFPDGGTDVERAVRDTAAIVQAGAQEVDVVLPWRAFLAGDTASATRVLQAVRRACEGLVLKVILETGEIRDPARIAQASRLALDCGADFLKTSTGKTATSATLEAARAMLQTIAADSRLCSVTGFKPSGGIRTVADAAGFIALTEELLGPQALNPQRFRIGASSVLADIEAVLSGAASPAPAAPGTY